MRCDNCGGEHFVEECDFGSEEQAAHEAGIRAEARREALEEAVGLLTEHARKENAVVSPGLAFAVGLLSALAKEPKPELKSMTVAEWAFGRKP